MCTGCMRLCKYQHFPQPHFTVVFPPPAPEKPGTAGQTRSREMVHLPPAAASVRLVQRRLQANIYKKRNRVTLGEVHCKAGPLLKLAYFRVRLGAVETSTVKFQVGLRPIRPEPQTSGRDSGTVWSVVVSVSCSGSPVSSHGFPRRRAKNNTT